ncbi:hypothetical protein GCK72_021210 [Caenorhabditis remanei]|uniref:F-box domain-containing protein n=1 Tax=Caenorhabditis remanei TaxID=31234 RepID=A0A6A5GHE1_CAERE|nr:hypothetical protein GCK72_021210 [Caenorhabditis remanei]KAF1754647.1 hypothetical protein GCK72_021210 [Caenorhabditis remanei]
MVDLPLNSPIDIRAHILYYAYQRYSIKKSYSNYKKLCIKFGKQAISFEEYEFLFMQYLGVDERELPDIRGCILSNVINGKSAEKSIDDLCDAFKNHKIDKEDHDYWHRRFENGHLFTRVTFSDFPEDVISEIVERCDIKSYLNLRNVSHGFRTVIDQQPPPCTHIQVHCGGDRMKIYVDYALIADSDNHYSNLRMKAFLKRMHGSLTLLLRNSKLRLKYFAFYANAASRETYLYTKVVISLLNSLNRELRRLIVYDISQWKTIDKSFKIYEKLCKVLGNEAISYDNYEYWFNRYLKENYYSPYKSSPPWIPDLEVCILADVIDGKSIENSYRDLCEAFGNNKMDKEYHATCYERYYFEAHRHALIMAERSVNTTLPDTYNDHDLKFSDFPEDVVTEIVDRCDLKAYLNLRNVSHSLRTIVDKRPPPCTDIEIVCRYDCILVKADKEILVHSGLVELNHSRTCSLDYIEKRVFRELEVLLKNPKLRLKSFRVDFQNHSMFFDMNASPRKYKKNCCKLLNSLNHEILVERCIIMMEDEKCERRILRCLKPGTLQKLVIGSSLSINEIGRIAQMDQWKQAKHLNLICFPELSIEYFSHFSTFEISFGTISTNNLVRLCDNLSKSTNFESCIIKSTRSLNIETIKNARNLQPSTSPNKYYVPNSNLVIQFPRGSVAYEISIRKL